VDEMERADLTNPGANLRHATDPGGPEEVARLYRAFMRLLERIFGADITTRTLDTVRKCAWA